MKKVVTFFDFPHISKSNRNFMTDALASLWSNDTAVILHLMITSSTGD